MQAPRPQSLHEAWSELLALLSQKGMREHFTSMLLLCVAPELLAVDLVGVVTSNVVLSVHTHVDFHPFFVRKNAVIRQVDELTNANTTLLKFTSRCVCRCTALV